MKVYQFTRCSVSASRRLYTDVPSLHGTHFHRDIDIPEFAPEAGPANSVRAHARIIDEACQLERMQRSQKVLSTGGR
jgi:hypothetical protein